MSSSKPPIPAPERTPQAQLTEAGVHALVGYQLAMATIVTDQVFDAQAADTGLHRVAFTLLALVRGNPGVTARQLARALAVTPPHIATWVERLASDGLLERERSRTDARVQHLRLTPAGDRRVSEATRRLKAAEDEALAGLSAAERAMLVELLHKVALARRREGPGGKD